MPFTRDAVDYFFKFTTVVNTISYTTSKRTILNVGITGPLQAVWFHRGFDGENLYRAAFKIAFDFLISEINNTHDLRNSYPNIEAKSTDFKFINPPDITEIPYKLKTFRSTYALEI